MINVQELFGGIDIYLFDQILKNRFSPNSIILDAGCGGGRNLNYFLQTGYEVFGIDGNPEAIEHLRYVAKTINPKLSPENFQVSTVEKMSFPDEKFDVVISSAVLHFAQSTEHFYQMFQEMWRVLKPNGLFFARLASNIGIENKVELIKDGRYFLPDGSERFLVNEELLETIENKFKAMRIEPIKTTNVQNLRCMTTWVLIKN